MMDTRPALINDILPWLRTTAASVAVRSPVATGIIDDLNPSSERGKVVMFSRTPDSRTSSFKGSTPLAVRGAVL